MRKIGTLVSLAVAAVLFSGSAAHAADGSSVDGTIVSGSTVCSWTGASADNTPPNTLVVDRNTVNPPGGNFGCNDGTEVVLVNNPVVSFDDAAGTATSDITVEVTQSGVTCTYQASGVTLNREGTTRTYSGGPYTGEKVDGSWFCPGTATIDSAEVVFY